MDPNPFVSAFTLLLNDFVTLTAYIEPHDDNLRTYSHRLYELLLRACTEFESVCKAKLIEQGATKSPASMDINDYKSLEGTLRLEPAEVGWHIWRPQASYVRPFTAWSTSAPPLSWYSCYNRVKHDRSGAFSMANMENSRLAISGLFATLGRLELLPTNPPGHRVIFQDLASRTNDIHYAYPQLSLRVPIL